MSVRPALVDCVILSLQDACVFYPCCKGCFSRIQADQQDPTRYRCSKCGYMCLRDDVDHRYRLSLRVTRDESIFGVTVFGSCLDPFFGIYATGLQRLVKSPDEPGKESTRSTLLVKAVRDCFIGRHVIFGIKCTNENPTPCTPCPCLAWKIAHSSTLSQGRTKVTETEPKPWLGKLAGSGSRDTKDTVQLIASQMIIPKALSPGGCTVVSYYQVLLQKVADCVLGAADQNKSTGQREAPLLLLRHHSTASSINTASLCTSGLLNQSQQRSQYQDCTLTPTPPWQQSLGLVTSSAEQDDGCSTQDSTEDDARKRSKNKTPNCIYRDKPGYRLAVEERQLSCLSPLQCSSHSTPVLVKYSTTPVDKAVGNSSPDHFPSEMKLLSTSHLTNTYLSDSLAWEDLPFSESLTEFLGVENKDVIMGGESEPNLRVQNQKETTTTNNLVVRPQSKDSSVELCASQKYRETEECRKPVHNSQAETLVLQEDEKTNSVSFEDDEEQLESSTYNCSADLFGGSLTLNTNTNTSSMHTETVATSPEASMLLTVPKKHCTGGGNLNISHSTPHRQKLRSNRCINEDYLVLPGTQDLDFIPPSQSTPIVRVVSKTGPVSKRIRAFGDSQTHSPVSSSVDKSLSRLNDKKIPKICSPCQSKRVRGDRLPCCGESTKENLLITTSSIHKVGSKRRFWKHKKHLHAPRVQKEAPNLGSPRRLNYSSFCDTTVRDNDDNDTLLVPPTPAAKSSQRVRLSTQSQTESCISELVCTEEKQEEGVSVTSLRRVQSRNPDSETYGKEMLDGSNYHLQDGENEACDWSRDLFSDSV